MYTTVKREPEKKSKEIVQKKNSDFSPVVQAKQKMPDDPLASWNKHTAHEAETDVIQLYTDEDVKKRAYEIWLKKGSPQQDEEGQSADWREAENQLQTDERAYHIWEKKGRIAGQTKEQQEADYLKAIEEGNKPIIRYVDSITDIREDSIADFTSDSMARYKNFADIYKQAAGGLTTIKFSYGGTDYNISKQGNEDACSYIVSKYNQMKNKFGPILLDNIGDGTGENMAMQYGEAENGQNITYAGLNSCIGITLTKENGRKAGVHFVVPFEPEQETIYNQRLDELIAFKNDHNFPVIDAKVLAKDENSKNDHIYSIEFISNNEGASAVARGLYPKLNGLIQIITQEDENFNESGVVIS